MEPSDEKSKKEAAGWILRLDRGLSGEEQDAFFEWLASDPQNHELLRRQRRSWSRLDLLSAWRPEHANRPNPDLLAPPVNKRLRRFIPWSLGIAATLIVSLILWSVGHQEAETARPDTATARLENRNLLPDGSTIKLNEGAEIQVFYSPESRRVRLDRGEAFFMVAEDASRPFVVEAQGIDLSALGTAFNVRLDDGKVEVLVTDGLVEVRQVAAAEDGVKLQRPKPVLAARQRAVVSLSERDAAPQVDTFTSSEIRRVLAWQQGPMTFASKPLSEIVEELNRLNETQLAIATPEMASMRFSGTFHSDNVLGFVRLLESGFGAEAEPVGESKLVLRMKIDEVSK